MLRGLALTPPIVGRISIGRVVEKNGKRLPEADDEFTVTSQVQSRDGWVPHPVDESLRKAAGGKLRSIPVRLLFDDPDLNLRASYCLFDRVTGRPVCVGDGSTCKRSAGGGIQSLPCPAPDACELANAGCKPYGRLNVRIGDEDELGGFVFRTAGFNSIRTLATRLQYFHAVSGGRLACLSLELRLRGKSTTQSHRAPVYYVDLVTRPGTTLSQTLAAGKSMHEERQAAGFNQAALDQAAREGLARGAFEESAEDGAAVVEEFYPATPRGDDGSTQAAPTHLSLSTRLHSKAADVASTRRRDSESHSAKEDKK